MIDMDRLTEFFEYLQDASSFSMLGVIWIVQLLVYPGFQHIAPADFTSRHREHVRRISWVVIPLMLSELTATLYLTLFTPSPGQALLMACTGIAWASTFLIQVPLHDNLRKGFDASRIQRLISTNWIRTLAWTAKSVALMVQALN